MLLLMLITYMCCNCSLNWQHQLCKNPRPNPDIKTLFIDHTCGPSNGGRIPPPMNNPIVGAISNMNNMKPLPGAVLPLGANGVL
jgi:hypothetical protein